MTSHLFSFYVPALVESDATIEIGGDEHRHLARVLRMSRGEAIRVTNGRGLRVAAAIETVGASKTIARVTAVDELDPPPTRLALALGVIQRAHFEVAVSQCVEVGVTEFIPVLAEKCHARAWSSATRARAQRVAMSAMKQSNRSWLPPIHDAVTVAGLARSVGTFARAVLADADGGREVPVARGDTLAIVGPEGGFTDSEVEALVVAGATRAALSRHRLRAETAAVVLAAALGRGV
jgi:16S rRNA (uracil1498-N3)-methyltransferase